MFPLTPYPFPVEQRTNHERAPAIQQRPFPGPRLRSLDVYIYLSFAPDSEIPGRNLVGARAIAAELRLPFADHLQRHLAHVLLATPSAHVPGGAAILGDHELRALVAIGRAPHPDDGSERGSLPRPPDAGEEVQDFSRLEPLFHGLKSTSTPPPRRRAPRTCPSSPPCASGR